MSAHVVIGLVLLGLVAAGYPAHRFALLREENTLLRMRLSEALGHPAAGPVARVVPLAKNPAHERISARIAANEAGRADLTLVLDEVTEEVSWRG